ncbi:MAG: arylsulfatase [Candidatus Sumerlaeia bacterium]|nr:arylsulfatase [Candidatus Sumerlaeia bacterium]
MKTQKVFLATVLAGLLAGCSHGGSIAVHGERAGTPKSPPNIILVVADDLGWGDVGFQGQEVIQTPNIDRIAAAGVQFPQFYASSPICAPARAALTTGRHTGRTVVRGNVLEQRLMPHEPSIAEVMKEAGYSTALIGKWGLGGADFPEHHGGTGDLIPEALDSLPTRRGFDYFFGYLDQLSAHYYDPETLWRNEEKIPIEGNYGLPREDRTVYSHDLLTGEVIDIIDGADGETPIFLQVSYILPHRETVAPPGENPYADEDWPEVEKAFAYMVTYLDMEVGMIMDAVAANTSISDNTVLIFTSDNGPQATDGHSPAFFNSSGPYRGAKRDLYEGGIRVPFIATWPGKIEPGSISHHIGDFADLLPTFADLAGTEPPEDIDGRSIANALLGTGNPPERPHFVWTFLEPMGGPGESPSRVAVLRHPWKMVIKADGVRELFNLDDDPGETTNLAAHHPEILMELETVAEREIQPPIEGLLFHTGDSE